MKISETIDFFYQNNMMGKQTSIPVYAMDKPSSAGYAIGGAIGAAVAQAAAQKYILEYNEAGFTFHKLQGDYSPANDGFQLERGNIKRIKGGGLLSGGLYVFRDNNNVKYKIVIPRRAKGFKQQKENLKKIKDIIKTEFGKK
ncbi:MAG: hypothetical protein LBI03_01540 [Clostridiales bacterium]|jgi:hypothetical protein|nr:hypothetical protein [Clostridiales bacterium]